MRVALLLLGCGRPDASDEVALEVFAATSLTDAFEDLAEDFEAANPGVDVRLTFAGSQVLRLQIEQGAAADVFASADERHVQALVDAGDIATAVPFAGNRLVVIVPRDDPDAIDHFEALPRVERLVVGTDNGPVGTYTRQMLDRARSMLGAAFVDAVERRIVSEESNVRLVRAKVELGEADAAIVYRTDVSDRVRAVPVPDEIDVRARYPIGRLVRSEAPDEAQGFVDFVRSPSGLAVLEAHGFSGPSE